MMLADYQTEYDRLLATKPVSVEMIHHLRDWSLALIKKKEYDDALTKVEEYLYRAFLGDQQKYEGYQFFSFKPFSEYSLKDVKEDKLSVCHPQNFNDPLDTVLFTFLHEKIRTETDPCQQTRYCMLLKAAHHLKMRCFVRTTPLVMPDNTPGEKSQDVRDINPLMWAHYAKNHTGFCSLYELDDSFVKSDDTKKSFSRMAIMQYKDTIDINNLKISEAYLWKNSIWSYENEVRVIDYNLENKDDYASIPAPPLKAVYLGLRCSSDDRIEMENALRGKTVELYQMTTDPKDICKLIPERIG